MKPAAFDYARPASAAEATPLLAEAEARPLSGGMSLGPMLNLRLARPSRLIDITRLPGLTEASETPTHIRLGAAITHASIEDGETPEPLPGLLRHIAGGIAYRAVRTRGTIGGSLAHADPAADWLTAMTLLDAEIETLQGRRIPIRGFTRGAYATALPAGDIITAIHIPRASASARWGWHKICRKSGEFAQAIGAALIDPERGTARLIAGATGGAPLPLDALAADLARTATPPSPDALRSALTEALTAANLPAEPVKLKLLTTALNRAIRDLLAP